MAQQTNSPKGLRKTAQGCREAKSEQLPWVRPTTIRSTLKGLRGAASPLRNPFGIKVCEDFFPRVVAVRQPWAILRNSFGIIAADVIEERERSLNGPEKCNLHGTRHGNKRSLNPECQSSSIATGQPSAMLPANAKIFGSTESVIYRTDPSPMP